MKKLTLKQVNDHIHTKYPLINVAKHHDAASFWIYSENTKTSIDIQYLFTATIDVAAVNHLTLDQWMKRVEYLLGDEERSVYDNRRPVKFKYEIVSVDSGVKYYLDQTTDWNMARQIMEIHCVRYCEEAVRESGARHVVRIQCNDQNLHEVVISSTKYPV